MSTKKLKGAGGGGGDVNNVADNLFSTDAFEFILGISEGEIGGLVGDTPEEWLQNLFVDDIPVLNSTLEHNFDNSSLLIRMEKGTRLTAMEDVDFGQTPIWYALGGSSVSEPVQATLAYDSPVTQTTPVLSRGFDEIEVRLTIPQLVKYTDEGSKEHTVRFLIEYKKTTDATWEGRLRSVTGKTTVTPFVHVEKIALPRTNPEDLYEIRVEKHTLDSDDEAVAELVWSSYELLTKTGDAYTPNGVDYDNEDLEYHPGTAMLQVTGVLGQQLNRIPTVNGNFRGLLCAMPTNYDPITKTYDESSAWDGQFKSQKHWTDNPFWIAYEMVTNLDWGMVRFNPRVKINRYEIYQMAKWADGYNAITGVKDLTNPVTGETEVARYTFNAVITDPQNGWDVIKYVLGAAFAQPVETDSGEIRFIADIPAEPVATITPEMARMDDEVTPFSYSFSALSERKNAITSSYLDASMEYKEQFVAEIRDEDSILRHGLNPHEFHAAGCTNGWECKRRMYFFLSTVQTEVRTVNFRLPLSGIALEPMDIVNVVDPDMGNGLSGRMVSGTGSTLEVRDPLYFGAAGAYKLTVEGKTTSHEYTISIGPSQVGVGVSTFSLSGNLPAESELNRFAPVFIQADEAENDVGLPKPYRISSITEDESNPGFYAITAQEVNPNKHTDADNLVVSEMPLFGTIRRPKPRRVANLRVVHQENFWTGEVEQINIWLGWEEPHDLPAGGYYEIKVKENSLNGRALLFKSTRPGFELPNVSRGELIIEVRSVYGSEESAVEKIVWNTNAISAEDLEAANVLPQFTTTFNNDHLIVETVVPYSFGAATRNTVDVLSSGAVRGLRFKVYDDVDPQNRALIYEQTGYSRFEIPKTLFEILLGKKGYVPSDLYIEVRVIDNVGEVYPAEENAPFTITVGTPVADISNIVYSRLAGTSALHHFDWDDNNYGYELTLYKPDRLSIINQVQVFEDSWSFGFLDPDEGYMLRIRGFDSALNFGKPKDHFFNVEVETTPTGAPNIGNAEGVITVTPPAPSRANAYYEFKYGLINDLQTAANGTSGNALTIYARQANLTYYVWYRLVTEEGRGGWVTRSVISSGQTTYSWTVYADDAVGTNITAEDDSKPYLGFATNKQTETPDLSDPSIYTWIKNGSTQWFIGTGEPSDTLGTQGDSYLDQATGDIYQKGISAWGEPVGNLQGGDGDKWFSGPYNPTDPENPYSGNEGDMFLNTLTFELFQKINNVWTSRGIIQGPKGDPGEPGQDGSPGASYRPIILFKRAATELDDTDLPQSLEFSFDTRALSNLSGWSENIPSGTDPVYTTSGVAHAPQGTGTDTSIELTTPEKFVEDGQPGQDGANGQSIYVATLYRRRATKPGAPTDPTTYSFTNNEITVLPANWYSEIPTDNGQPCWVVTVPFSIAGATGTDSSSSYSSVSELVRSGADGENGADGVDGTDGVSIVWKGSFSSHPSNPENGWAYRNTSTKKSYVYQGAWYQMTIDGVDGTDGNDGVSIIWKGESASPPANPQLNWAYRDTDNNRVYIYDGSAWVLMVLDGSDGTDGADGSPVQITYHANPVTSEPAKPTGDGTIGGWSPVPGAGKNWMSQKVSPDPATGVWGNPILMTGKDGSDGQDGEDGYSYYQYQLFKRASSQPAKPSGGNFNFGTNVITAPSGWSKEPPAGDLPLYGSLAQASIQGDTGTVTPTYSATYHIVSNGEDGSNGDRGAGHYYRAISGTSWSNSEANTATPGSNVNGDRVTLYNNGSEYVETRFWNGSVWDGSEFTVIDGSLIVNVAAFIPKIFSEEIEVTNTVTATKGNVTAQMSAVNPYAFSLSRNGQTIFGIGDGVNDVLNGSGLMPGSVKASALAEDVYNAIADNLGQSTPDAGGFKNAEFSFSRDDEGTEIARISGFKHGQNAININWSARANYSRPTSPGAIDITIRVQQSPAGANSWTTIDSHVFQAFVQQDSQSGTYFVTVDEDVEVPPQGPATGEYDFRLYLHVCDDGMSREAVGSFTVQENAAGTSIDWGQINNRPATATRWPTKDEVGLGRVENREFRWQFGSAGLLTHIWGSENSSTVQKVFTPNNLRDAMDLSGYMRKNQFESTTGNLEIANAQPTLTFNDTTGTVIVLRNQSGVMYFDVGGTARKIYHEGHKPTLGELGAAAADHGHGEYVVKSSNATLNSLTINSSLNSVDINTRVIRNMGGSHLALIAGDANGNWVEPAVSENQEYVYVVGEQGLRVQTPDRAHSNFETGWSWKETIINGEEIRIDGNLVYHPGHKPYFNEILGTISTSQLPAIDADTLDGQHGSAYARSNADDTISGKFHFTNGGTIGDSVSNMGNAPIFIGSTSTGIAIDSNEIFGAGVMYIRGTSQIRIDPDDDIFLQPKGGDVRTDAHIRIENGYWLRFTNNGDEIRLNSSGANRLDIYNQTAGKYGDVRMGAIRAEDKITVISGGIEVNVGNWDDYGLRLNGTAPSIYYNQTDDGNPNLYAGINTNSYYLLPDSDSNGSFESPYLLQVNFNGGMYHLGREVITSGIGQVVTGNKIFADDVTLYRGYMHPGKTFTFLHNDSEGESDGSVDISIDGSDYLRYRFGGTPTLNGMTINNYDTTVIKLNRNGSIETTAQIDAQNYYVHAGAGKGIRFWNGSETYSIYMSEYSDSTYGGRINGNSDYNMYFKMGGGTNRGFVFKSGNTPFVHLAWSGSYIRSHNSDVLTVSRSAGDGAGIKFLSEDDGGQYGTFRYYFSNGNPFGGNAAFIIDGSMTPTNLGCTGNILQKYSDETLKDFGDRVDGLNIVMQLDGRYYHANAIAESLGYDRSEREIGLSAQQVQKFLPELVGIAGISKKAGRDILTLKYERMVPVLIEAIKTVKRESDARYSELSSRIERLEAAA